MTLHCSAAFHSQAFSGSEDKAQQQNSRMGLVTGWHDQNRRSWPTKMGVSHNWVPQNHWFPMKNEDFRMSLASTTGTRKSRDVWCTPFSVPAMWTLQFALLSGQEVTVRSQVLVARIWFELQEKAFGISTTLGHQSPMSQYSVEVQAEPEETIDNVLNKAQEALNVLIVSVVSSSGTLLDITRCDGSRVWVDIENDSRGK